MFVLLSGVFGVWAHFHHSNLSKLALPGSARRVLARPTTVSCPLQPAYPGSTAPSTNAPQYRNRRLFASCTTHCSPSCRFSPVIALHVMMVHLCVLIESKPSPCSIH